VDFELTKEQKDIKRSAREFAEGEFPEFAKECDLNEKLEMSLLKKARELGFVGCYVPEAYGGMGLGFFEKALIIEEFWRIDPGLAQAIVAVTFGAEIIIDHATEAQKEKYLRPLVEGDAIMATAITEPDAGSDVTAAQTTAVRQGDEYVINGNKMFISNGHLADYILVLCRAHPDEPSRHNQFSLIVVETDRKGFVANPLKNKMGLRAAAVAELAFKDVRVPVENLIGREKRGFQQVLGLFNRERITVCAQACGISQGALEMAIKHISQRVQFGKKLASFQALRFKIAEMATLIEAGRSLYYRAAWGLDSGKEDHSLIAMAKWYCAQNAVSIVNEALQMHGGYGFFNEYDIARFYRDVKVLEIYEGAKEIEKIVVANALLGKG